MKSVRRIEGNFFCPLKYMYLCKTILTYCTSFPALKVLFWPGRPTNALVEFIIFLGGDASGRIKFPHVRTFSEK